MHRDPPEWHHLPTKYHEDLNLKPSLLLTPILVVEKEWHSNGVKLKMMRFKLQSPSPMGNSPAGCGSEEKKTISLLKIKPQSFRHQGFTLFVKSKKRTLQRCIQHTINTLFWLLEILCSQITYVLQSIIH
jgi:hypothetical protein